MLLNGNPFFILGASSRDSRQRIVELAEEQSLHIDQATCSRCSAELINPRQRLTAELAWLPGCSAESAEELVSRIINWRGGPLPTLPSPLATANLHVTALAFGPAGGGQLSEHLLNIAGTCERLDAGEVRALVNEDRAAAGFGRVDSDSEVERALETRLASYRTVLTGVLKGLPSHQLIPVLTQALEQGTEKGSTHGPALLHSLIDVLSVDLHAVLDTKRSAVETAMEEVRVAGAGKQKDALDKALGQLEGAIRQWDWFAQPLQLSAQARGQDHQPSRELAVAIRGLAIELHNEHGQTETAQKISEMIHESFSELPRMAEVVRNDLDQLETLISQQQESNERLSEERTLFAGMQKITGTPFMGTINGIGTKLYGREGYHEPTQTYTTTLYFVVLFIPIVPLARYRVRDAEGGGWYFIGRMPFGTSQRWHLGVVAAGIVIWLMTAMSSPDAAPSNYSLEPSSNPAPNAGAPTLFQSPGLSDSALVVTAADGEALLKQRPQATRSRTELGRWIDAERVRLGAVEAEIKSMDRNLESQSSEIALLKGRFGYFEAIAVDGKLPPEEYDDYELLRLRYNALIDEYNAQLAKRKLRYASYSVAVDAANDSVEVYNRMR